VYSSSVDSVERAHERTSEARRTLQADRPVPAVAGSLPVMAPKYYCDYCDKSFVDNSISRRRHLGSVTHRRNVKEHQDAVRCAWRVLRQRRLRNGWKRSLGFARPVVPAHAEMYSGASRQGAAQARVGRGPSWWL